STSFFTRTANGPFSTYQRPRQTEGQLKIVHHRLSAANQPLGSVRRLVLEQAGAKNGHLDQLDCLVETGADQALFRRAGAVPSKGLCLRLPQPLTRQCAAPRPQ